MLKAKRLIAFYEKNKELLNRLNDNEKDELNAVIEFYSEDYKGNKNCIYK